MPWIGYYIEQGSIWYGERCFDVPEELVKRVRVANIVDPIAAKNMVRSLNALAHRDARVHRNAEREAFLALAFEANDGSMSGGLGESRIAAEGGGA